MKRFSALLFSIIFILSLASCNSNKNNDNTPSSVLDATSESQTNDQTESESDSSESDKSQTTDSRILIAYFTVPEDVNTTDAVAGASIVVKDGEKLGNTEYVARLIQENICGDLFRIETVVDYPLDHDPLVDQAADEQSANKRPELKNHVKDFEQYDTIIIGYPNWWADLPMPVYTFLEEYDFSSKTIIPFVTHGGSGLSSTVRTISDLQPNANISDNALSISRNSVATCEDQVAQWSNSLNISTK